MHPLNYVPPPRGEEGHCGVFYFEYAAGKYERDEMQPRKMMLMIGAIAAVSLLLSGCGAESVVKKIDHVTIQCSDAQALYSVMTETLGLPVAWPFSEYPEFQTGGIQAGNANIETLHYGPPGDTGTSLYGIVLEPYPLDEVTVELENRGSEPSKPEVQKREIDGKSVPFWTNVYLKALSPEGYIVYLCEYEEAAKSALPSSDVGDPLGKIGVESVREIVITSRDPEKLREKWEEVFAPYSFSPEGLMSIGTGPAIRITSGKEDAIEALVLEVSSIEKAKAFLENNSLLGTSSADELRIDPDEVQGLDIRVVEK